MEGNANIASKHEVAVAEVVGPPGGIPDEEAASLVYGDATIAVARVVGPHADVGLPGLRRLFGPPADRRKRDDRDGTLADERLDPVNLGVELLDHGCLVHKPFQRLVREDDNLVAVSIEGTQLRDHGLEFWRGACLSGPDLEAARLFHHALVEVERGNLVTGSGALYPTKHHQMAVITKPALWQPQRVSLEFKRIARHGRVVCRAAVARCSAASALGGGIRWYAALGACKERMHRCLGTGWRGSSQAFGWRWCVVGTLPQHWRRGG
mmetsp:Transcript_22588/g.67956  ORF Transcript_22588/g.67956 Transcript_22588/m.67956 type:complete len:266 (-) Transcript_22588:216-1013(-)